MKDYSKEVIELIKRYRKENIIFGKAWDFLYRRVKISEEEVKKEILNCKNLAFAEEQIKNGEKRYALFFIYGGKRGRKYVINFRCFQIRIITIIPLGRTTIKRYRKKGLNI